MPEPPIISGGVIVNVDGHEVLVAPPPLTTAFITPVDGQTASAHRSITVTVQASPDTARIRFYINNSMAKSATGTALTYRWRPKQDGNYELKAVAVDASNNAGVPSVIHVAVASTFGVLTEGGGV